VNREWDPFLDSTNILLDPKGYTPSPTEKVVSKQSSGKEIRSTKHDKGKGKEIDDSPPGHTNNKKGRRLQFTDEVEEIPRVSSLATRLATKRIHVPALHTQSIEHSTQEIHEDQVQREDKEQIIKELKE
jgi:hypothetical protein